MTCPNPEILVEFVDSTLEPRLASDLEDHLAECESCRQVLSDLGRALAVNENWEADEPTEVLDLASLSPGSRIGHFVVSGPIGSGSMGHVLRAYDCSLAREVAIKVLASGQGTGLVDNVARQRLIREAQAMARLSHPNVNTVFEVGTVGDQVYMAMELVPEGSVRQWMKQQDHHWVDILSLFVGAGWGLQAAHDVGLIHRDFKPDNILVGSGGIARVTDFGLVSANQGGVGTDVPIDLQASPTLTRTGDVFGTPAYMSPEQFEGRSVDARADQFAFCVALWEALAGRRPFGEENYATLLTNVCAGNILPPPPGVSAPPAIFDVLRKGLSVDANDRFPAMIQLLEKLQAFILREQMAHLGGTTGDAAPVSGASPTVERPTEGRSSRRGLLLSVLLLVPAMAAAATLLVMNEAPPKRALEQQRALLEPISSPSVVAGAAPVLEQEEPQETAKETATVESPAIATAEQADAGPASRELSEVELSISSKPSGAMVYRRVDGVRLGKTPWHRSFEEEDSVVEFIVRHPGYEDASLELSLATGGEAHLVLDKKRQKRRHKGRGRRNGSKAASPTEAKSDELPAKMILDPYGGSK